MLANSERLHQCLLTDSTKETWTETINDLLTDQPRRTRLALMAHEHVLKQNDPNRVIST